MRTEPPRSVGGAPKPTIIRKILILFGALVAAVIGTAIYSALLESRRATQQAIQETVAKLDIPLSIQTNEIEKLVLISETVKEQSQKFCDFLDRDQISPISSMAKSIAAMFDLDLVFFFNEKRELLTTSQTGTHFGSPGLFAPLVRDTTERVGLEEIPGSLVEAQLGNLKASCSSGAYLCFLSVVHILNDTGDIYAYILLVNVINGNRDLAARMAKIAEAEIVYYDRNGQCLLSSFPFASIPYPKKGLFSVGGKTYLVSTRTIQDYQSKGIAEIAVALDDQPFRDRRRHLLVLSLVPFFFAGGICVLLFYLLKQRVFNRINQLIGALRSVTEGAGDLGIRLKVRESEDPRKDLDEVENMCIDFNHMLDKLESTYNALIAARKEAEMANTAKSEFLANMSHEIRTPMNAVIGFTEMLQDTRMGEDQKEYVAAIQRSGESLLSLINDILDFSKIEAGQLELEDIDFDPELVLYDVCEMIYPKIGTKPVEILCHIGHDVPSQVKGDPTRIRQVLTNLMGNAAKFTDAGEIEVSLGTEERDGMVCLKMQVRDTGIGIPADKLTTIFEPFKQADGSTTRRYGGTGLGLSICRKVASLMGGDVHAVSPLEGGRGSLFVFTACVKPSPGKRSLQPDRACLAGKKALVVDDNRTNLQILRYDLERAGMRVTMLGDGREVVPTLARALQEGDPFDICACDLQMPHMNGHEVAQGIRRFEAEHAAGGKAPRRLPLICISSMSAGAMRDSRASGFDGYLAKPIRRQRLLEMMERLMLGGKAPHGEAMEGETQILTQYSVREEMKRSVRILLAEDNAFNQRLAVLMLTKAGYQVEVANNGREAVEKFRASPGGFDVILMDVQMPEMDGLEATTAIRTEEGASGVMSCAEAKGHIPIVAMTAHAMKGDRDLCLGAGMDDYVTKPITRDKVFDILRKWVFTRSG